MTRQVLPHGDGSMFLLCAAHELQATSAAAQKACGIEKGGLSSLADRQRQSGRGCDEGGGNPVANGVAEVVTTVRLAHYARRVFNANGFNNATLNA